jgi:hypothetical protein
MLSPRYLMIPKKINLIGYDYKIEYVKETLLSNACATIDFDEQKIFIKKGQPAIENLEALIHEIVEFINEKNELKMTHNQIQSVGFNLTGVLASNEIFSPEILSSSKERVTVTGFNGEKE